MLIIIAGIFIVGIILAVWTFLPSGGDYGYAREHRPIFPAPRRETAVSFETQDLRRKNSELQNELESAKKAQADLKVELKENSDLVNEVKMLNIQLAAYNKEAERLKLEAQEAKTGQEVLCQDYASLKQKYAEELAKIDLLKQQLQEAQTKQPGAEWIAKKEHDELKAKLEAAEEVLRIVHGAGK